MPDYSAKVSMEDYISKKLQPVVLTKEQKRDKQRSCNAGEQHLLRAATMTLMWVARQLRSDMIGPVSLLTRKICDATVEDIIEIGKIIDFLKKTKEMLLRG